MVFELPTVFQKDIAKNTAKNYKAKLNKLAAEGFATVDDLKKRRLDVIKAIQRLVGGSATDKERHEQRVYLSAIFWVIKIGKRNRYYTHYQKVLPVKNTITEEDWVKRTNYVAPADD
jgi:hypothetical protein